jgi:hypothetical protein
MKKELIWNTYTKLQLWVLDFNINITTFCMIALSINIMFYTKDNNFAYPICLILCIAVIANLRQYKIYFNKKDKNEKLTKDEANYLSNNSAITCSLVGLASVAFLFGSSEHGDTPLYFRFIGLFLFSYIVLNGIIVFRTFLKKEGNI